MRRNGTPGNLTREQMVEIIRNRGSVIYKGALYNNVAALPTLAEMSLGNADSEKAAKQELEAQLEGLKAQLALLQTEPARTEKAKPAKE